MMQPISLAYSPDSDDAFMVYALKNKLIDLKGVEFQFFSADIQELNQCAAQERYDISAISMAAYPALKPAYALMPIGASIGDGFGPAIVSAQKISSLDELAGRRIAVPGLQTSAYFAAKILLPEFTAVPLPFDEIAPAVLAGQVDAGILIHELQIAAEGSGLNRFSDLGTLWQKRFQLPLPLGAIIIKRSLGKQTIQLLTELYRQSITWALDHRGLAVAQASKAAKAGLEGELADKYIEMYVNQRSLLLDDDVVQAMRTLYQEGARAGLCEDISAEDLTCPF